MNSFKTATALAKHAGEYETLQDAKADVKLAEFRLFSEQNNLRKRLRTMRKRDSHCDHFTVQETARTSEAMRMISRRLDQDASFVRANESKMNAVLAAFRLAEDDDQTDDEPLIVLKPRKRRRLIPNFPPGVFEREDVASVIVGFLSAKDNFRNLALVSNDMNRRVTKFVQRVRIRRFICGGIVHMKSLCKLACDYITPTQLEAVAPRLEYFEVKHWEGGVERLMELHWPHLHTLIIPNTLSTMFWRTFRPEAFPVIKKLAARSSWEPAMFVRIRQLMEAGSLHLESFPQFRVEGTALENYLWIHNHVGSTNFSLDTWTPHQLQMFRDRICPARITDLSICVGAVDISWVLGLPNLRKLDCRGKFLPIEADVEPNTTITNLNLSYQGEDVVSPVSILSKIGPQLTKIQLDVLFMRQLLALSETMTWTESVEELSLTCLRRAVFQVPINRFPRLKILNLPYLNDTQMYVVLCDVLRQERHGLLVKIPSFVTNKVGSVLYHYEKTAKKTRVQIKGFQSEFYNTIMANAKFVILQ